MERRHVKAVSAVSNAGVGDAIDPTTFSSWTRLIRVTASIARLPEKIRPRRSVQSGRKGPLTPEELSKVEILKIQRAQRHLKSRIQNGDFKALSPFIDDTGIIRVRGRIDKRQSTPPFFPATTGFRSSSQHEHHQGYSGVATSIAKPDQEIGVFALILKANKPSKSLKFKCVFRRIMAHETADGRSSFVSIGTSHPTVLLHSLWLLWLVYCQNWSAQNS